MKYVAEGIISASKMLNLQLPLVVRLQGVRKAGQGGSQSQLTPCSALLSSNGM